MWSPATVARFLSPPARRVLAAVAVVAALFFLALGAAWSRFFVRGQLAGAPTAAGVFLLPQPRATRLLASKYTEAVADAIWTRVLVYHGEHFARRLVPHDLHAYMDALTALDPYFRAPYSWGGFAVTFAHYSGVPQPRDILYAVELLRRGVARFPDDGELHGTLGYLLYYELPRWVRDPETVLRAKIEGAEQLRLQADLGAGPDWMVLSAATALEKINLDELAAGLLERAALTVGDPNVRAQVLGRLARLRQDVDTERLRHAADTLAGMALRELPYVTSNQYLLLSSPRDRARMAEGLLPEHAIGRRADRQWTAVP
ncbi:MAG: hypothetical protein HY907_08100 [Deltaproteobacteria bacterium]|nr:hypothetical protein [Deltaproteobacteria bacterium]